MADEVADLQADRLRADDACLDERLAELLAGLRPAALQLAPEHLGGPRCERRVDPEAPVLVAARLVDAGRGERQQPANVLDGDEVPRRAHDVGPHDRARIEQRVEVGLRRPRRPLRDGPFRPGVVLRLDGQQVADDVDRFLERRPDEPLDTEPAPRDAGAGALVQSIAGQVSRGRRGPGRRSG